MRIQRAACCFACDSMPIWIVKAVAICVCIRSTDKLKYMCVVCLCPTLKMKESFNSLETIKKVVLWLAWLCGAVCSGCNAFGTILIVSLCCCCILLFSNISFAVTVSYIQSDNSRTVEIFIADALKHANQTHFRETTTMMTTMETEKKRRTTHSHQDDRSQMANNLISALYKQWYKLMKEKKQ